MPWIPDRTSHCNDVIMGAMACQITGVSIVCSSVSSGADQRKHQSFASLAFVRGIHRPPVNSPYKGPVTRKMFPFDDVIMKQLILLIRSDSVTTETEKSQIWQKIVSGRSGTCHFDNLRWSQWQKFRQNDISVLVLRHCDPLEYCLTNAHKTS